MSVKKILLFGMCGAGKDTQAEALSRELGIPAFSLGKILREVANRPSSWQTEIQTNLAAGTLISPETAREIMKHRLLDPETQKIGYILVGYPRTAKTVESFLEYELPTHVVLLNISRHIALERSLKRGRVDDSTEMVERRMNRFVEEELPAWEVFKSDPRVNSFEVDADGSIEDVTGEILSKLNFTNIS